MNYSPAVLARVRDPRYVGWLNKDSPDVGTGEAGTLARGTMTRIQVRVDGINRRVDEAVFKVFGCSAAIASASLVAEKLCGLPIDAARDMEALTVVAELELPFERAGVAGLAVEAAKSAIKDWERKHDRNL